LYGDYSKGYLYIWSIIKNTTMKNETLTLEDILNSELITGMIEQEDKELAEAGWTYEEVKSLADSIAKK
jgi:hypothetical protein